MGLGRTFPNGEMGQMSGEEQNLVAAQRVDFLSEADPPLSADHVNEIVQGHISGGMGHGLIEKAMMRALNVSQPVQVKSVFHGVSFRSFPFTIAVIGVFFAIIHQK
jgi:hypothetical protein